MGDYLAKGWECLIPLAALATIKNKYPTIEKDFKLFKANKTILLENCKKQGKALECDQVFKILCDDKAQKGAEELKTSNHIIF